jgi:hypothetical protein
MLFFDKIEMVTSIFCTSHIIEVFLVNASIREHMCSFSLVNFISQQAAVPAFALSCMYVCASHE